ncbi:hypothetical protein B0A49_04854 [Cryomyces minteri]|uniref:BRCT domain-containing protein n=1 Tax=Cryomyces minteri TaxID=331657 RepID=A0A4U0WZQ3_9PEZI|nr:hypothetical protein B0A49_04854 [Cryomyces minteri]
MVDGEDYVRSQAPLAGVIMCCTSIAPEQRTELATIATQMGAVHKLDLTSDVTHLIVGNTETPKYQYVAKQRPDVKVLRPEWVEAVRLSWMEGGDTDVAALEEEYRLATFAGLTICVTGFDDLEQRTRIQNTVVANGAEYHGDLTRVVSHLIAAAPQGAKYQHSLQWGIKTVSLLWLEDSIERGMVLDETLYDPRLPAEEQGKGAWIPAVKQQTSAKRKARTENVTELPDAGKRKLRRTASTKLNSQSEMLWASFSHGGDSRSKGAQQQLNSANFDESKRSPVPVRAAGGYPQVLVGEGLSGLFQGIPIFTHGFSGKKKETLHAHLCSRGACLIPDIEGIGHLAEDQLRRGIVVVPHDSPGTLVKSLPEEISRLTLASEWWVERCIFRQTCVDPKTDVFCRPLAVDMPIPGFEDMIICSTSFDSVGLMHMSRAVKLMGAIYDEYFKPAASVLVCGSKTPNEQKLRHAARFQIPAVSADWLSACLEMGEKQPFSSYLVPLPTIIEVAPPEPRSPEQAPADEGKTRRAPDAAGRNVSDARPSKSKERRSQPPSRLQVENQRPSPDGVVLRGMDVQAPNHANNRDTRSDHVKSNTAFGDGTTPNALQELPPEMNSPRKPTPSPISPVPKPSPTKSEPESDFLPRARKAPKLAIPPTLPTTHTIADSTASAASTLTASIAELLVAQQQAAALPAPAPQMTRERRRTRRLGRAPSNVSHNSASASATLSRASSIDESGPSLRERERGERGSAGAGADGPARRHGSTTTSNGASNVEFQPSQALTYEDADAQARRDEMIVRMGGRVAEGRTGTVVQSVGVVRDAALEGGNVGSRVRARGRVAKGG